jgi:hypothetical protein
MENDMSKQQHLVEQARNLLERAAVADPDSPVQVYIEKAVAATDAALTGSDAEKVRGYEGQFTTKKGEIR